MVEEKKLQLNRQMSGDIATGGPTRTPEELDRLAWQQRKGMHIDTLTPDELKRALAEKTAKEQQLQKDAAEMNTLYAARDERFVDDVEKSCLDGSPEERLARCLIRCSMKGVFGLNPMQDPREKAKIISELLRLHGIQIKDSKEKPSREDFKQSYYFVSDPYVRKGDVVLTRRAMFPQTRTE